MGTTMGESAAIIAGAFAGTGLGRLFAATERGFTGIVEGRVRTLTTATVKEVGYHRVTTDGCVQSAVTRADLACARQSLTVLGTSTQKVAFAAIKSLAPMMALGPDGAYHIYLGSDHDTISSPVCVRVNVVAAVDDMRELLSLTRDHRCASVDLEEEGDSLTGSDPGNAFDGNWCASWFCGFGGSCGDDGSRFLRAAAGVGQVITVDLIVDIRHVTSCQRLVSSMEFGPNKTCPMWTGVRLDTLVANGITGNKVSAKHHAYLCASMKVIMAGMVMNVNEDGAMWFRVLDYQDAVVEIRRDDDPAEMAEEAAQNRDGSCLEGFTQIAAPAEVVKTLAVSDYTVNADAFYKHCDTDLNDTAIAATIGVDIVATRAPLNHKDVETYISGIMRHFINPSSVETVGGMTFQYLLEYKPKKISEEFMQAWDVFDDIIMARVDELFSDLQLNKALAGWSSTEEIMSDKCTDDHLAFAEAFWHDGASQDDFATWLKVHAFCKAGENSTRGRLICQPYGPEGRNSDGTSDRTHHAITSQYVSAFEHVLLLICNHWSVKGLDEAGQKTAIVSIMSTCSKHAQWYSFDTSQNDTSFIEEYLKRSMRSIMRVAAKVMEGTLGEGEGCDFLHLDRKGYKGMVVRTIYLTLIVRGIHLLSGVGDTSTTNRIVSMVKIIAWAKRVLDEAAYNKFLHCITHGVDDPRFINTVTETSNWLYANKKMWDPSSPMKALCEGDDKVAVIDQGNATPDRAHCLRQWCTLCADANFIETEDHMLASTGAKATPVFCSRVFAASLVSVNADGTATLSEGGFVPKPVKALGKAAWCLAGSLCVVEVDGQKTFVANAFNVKRMLTRFLSLAYYNRESLFVRSFHWAHVRYWCNKAKEAGVDLDVDRPVYAARDPEARGFAEPVDEPFTEWIERVQTAVYRPLERDQLYAAYAAWMTEPCLAQYIGNTQWNMEDVVADLMVAEDIMFSVDLVHDDIRSCSRILEILSERWVLQPVFLYHHKLALKSSRQNRQAFEKMSATLPDPVGAIARVRRAMEAGKTAKVKIVHTAEQLGQATQSHACHPPSGGHGASAGSVGSSSTEATTVGATKQQGKVRFDRAKGKAREFHHAGHGVTRGW